MRPEISVVMPVLNGIRYMSEAIESVLSQSFENIELIIVDDGSIDGSLDIARAFGLRDSRVTVLPQQHRGLVEALNRGCSAAQASYIARLDSDDVAEPLRLQLQWDYLQADLNCALVGTRVECIDEAGAILFRMNWPTDPAEVADNLLVDCCISHTTVMFRREVFDRVGRYRTLYLDAEDYDLFLRIADKHQLANLPFILGKYRLHSNQVSVNKFRQQIISAVGARLATKYRRLGWAEPTWHGECVGLEDLTAFRISAHRLDTLTQEYALSNNCLSEGWRWHRSHFYSDVLEKRALIS